MRCIAQAGRRDYRCCLQASTSAIGPTLPGCSGNGGRKNREAGAPVGLYSVLPVGKSRISESPSLTVFAAMACETRSKGAIESTGLRMFIHQG